MREVGLQPAAPDDDRARLAALEVDVAARDRELTSIKRELLALQSRYLDEIGPLYAELARVEAAIAEAEIALGLRPAPSERDGSVEEEAADADSGDPVGTAVGCGNRAAPSDDLRRMFRQLARTIHPDLALNDPARYRRHSLMAEANRAYAERDEDRLRLILRTWEADRDAVAGDGPDADRERVGRRIAALEARLLAMAAELADLRTSAIWRLKSKIDAARAQGWDLFAEMLREVRRDVRRASARLASLRR